MSDKAKKKPSRSAVIAVVALICLIIVPAVIMFNDVYKSWHIFTDKRVEKLEQTFGASFPKDVEFEYYKSVYAFQAGTYHTLYVTGIENPEEFCRSNITDVLFMADLSGEEPVVLKNNDKYENLDGNSFQGQEWRDGEARHTDFVCVANKDSYYSTVIYFFENDSGGYDVKFTK